ncbi:Nucleotidyltransferase/DNA polymerase involved in DNA repair [Sphingomonas palmae]|uniref:DNA-directed DNA polymerase n=1 Tax=Sphingomonas palmae TaxID=1855283 RepID=A0A1H7LUG2_9SPHN|nr:Nucleotidyltransferase/DNA polymerase involved in DNA repair [Sphingomonas palmae]
MRPFDRPLAGKDERAGGGSACWAGETRADVEQRIARMQSHQRPPMREMGRRSEAAEHAFKRLPGDDGGKSSGWPEPGFAGVPGARGGMVAIRFGGEGVRPTSIQRRRDPVVRTEPLPSTSASPDAGAVTAVARDGGRVSHAAGSIAAPTGPAPMCRSVDLHDRTATRETPLPRVTGDRTPRVDPGGPLPALHGRSDAGVRSAATIVGRADYPDISASTRHAASRRDPLAIASPGITTDPSLPALRLVGVAGAIESAASIGATTSDAEPARVRRSERPAIVPHALRPAVSTIRYPGDGPHPDKPSGGKGIGERRVTNGRVGSNDAGASVLPVAPFFDTGRSTAGTVARVCPPDTPTHPHAMPPHLSVHAPLVTVHKVGSRVEVAAACPAARMLGIECGMALTQVRAATPDVAVRDADAVGDRAALDRLATALARRWSPGVSVSDAPPDTISGEAGLFIDLTGVAHLHGGEVPMARRIVRLLARLGYDARVGIADTPAAAWALARFDAAPVTALPPAHGLSPFAGYPVTALRLDPAAAELMRRLGIDRVGQLAQMPRAPLVRRFGRAVATRLDQLIGAVAEPVVPVVPRDPAMVEQRLAEPILTAEPIAYWIAQLSGQLAQALAEQGRGARALVLALTRVDGEVQAIRVGFARATRDPQHMVRLLARRIELIDPGFGIEVVALHVTRDEALGPEALAGDLEEQVPDLAALVDAIVNRIGAAHLWRTRAVESDVPERSVAPAAPLDHAVEAGARLLRDDVRHLDTRGAAHPWHPRWPRPTRLLRRPEPIDHVMAELPDSYPRRFRWRGQMHQVVRGDGPERIAGEWWRRTAERQAVRDYFQVEDEAGQRFWLFRRGDGQRPETGDMTWHLHGTFG